MKIISLIVPLSLLVAAALFPAPVRSQIFGDRPQIIKFVIPVEISAVVGQPRSRDELTVCAANGPDSEHWLFEVDWTAKSNGRAYNRTAAVPATCTSWPIPPSLRPSLESGGYHVRATPVDIYTAGETITSIGGPQ